MDPKRLRDVGEAGLLAAVRPLLARHTEGLPLGTGDDVAISPPPSPGTRTIWTIDTMVEGTHFRWWPAMTPRALGAKLAAVNLSDIASKGGAPQYALLSLGVPADAEVARVAEFFEGLCDALAAAEVALIGGDTVLAPQWTLTLSLTGTLEESRGITARSRAKAGQTIFVTGWPGESAAGLEVLEGHAPRAADPDGVLVARHVAPTARLREGAALARAFADLAMMDSSDGLAHSVAEIARQSGVAAVISESAVPIADALAHFAREAVQDALELALYGGEDYELVFASSAGIDDVRALFVREGIATEVRAIGFVEAGEGLQLLRRDSRREKIGPMGYEHF